MEVWKPIESSPDFFVSNKGKIKGPNGHLKQSRSNRYGHLAVRILGKQRNVHILVLECFRGPRPSGHFGLHNNGVPEDNFLENLRWGTPLENAQDMVAHGRSARGLRNGKYTKPERTPRGDRCGSRTKPQSRPRGQSHPLVIDPSRAARGTYHGCAKLCPVDVERIRDLRRSGSSFEKIARWIGISKTQAMDIAKGKSWSHVQ